MAFTDEFPDFPAADMPAIPQGFVDISWENDSCPSFLNEPAGLILFVDYLDPALREYAECPRFSVAVWDEGTTNERPVESDDWADVQFFLGAKGLA